MRRERIILAMSSHSPAAPSVSILMCVHNRERFVDAAIKSVLAQTRTDLELVLLDDGSTDGSLAICRAHAQRDPRVRLFEGECKGAVRALNAAHTHARGRFIGWVDSDDMLHAEALAHTAAVLESRPDIGLVYTDHLIIDEQNHAAGLGQKATIPYSKEKLLTDFITFHFRLFRRELFDQIGGLDESFTAAADYDYCLRMSEITEFAKVEKPLYAYRVHAESISASRRLEQIEMSARAVRRALVRRGLADSMVLDVEILSRFHLRPRRADDPKLPTAL